MKTKEELEREIKKWRDSHKSGEFNPDYCEASQTLKETIAMLSEANEKIEELKRINKLAQKRIDDLCEMQYEQEDVTRVEVVDKNGRSYVNMNAKNVRLSYQDNGKTLKVFID